RREGYEFQVGKPEVVIKEIDGQKFGGETALEINVAESAILIEVAEPSIKSIELGSIMQIAVNASYTSGKPVENAALTAKIGKNEIELKRMSPGKILV
ncbi:MAG: GTP-binding protein TypA/BipA, partial [Candidatus Peregrinibacteria bacterium GW2011_GWA2_44_7]